MNGKPLAWTLDERGILNLKPHIQGLEAHLWVQARRTYCDRGHWEWGAVSVIQDPALAREPAYYFMRWETAVEEVELWLARQLNGATGKAVESIPLLGTEAADFSQAVGQARGWQWRDAGRNRRVAEADGAQATLSLTGTGQVRVEMAGVAGLDHADLFPRHYLSLANAVAETEAFLAWRLLEVPTQIPGPLAVEAPAVGEALAQAYAVPVAGGPRRRRP